MPNVLLVDDDRDLLEVIALSLKMIDGWEVLTAGSLNHALRQAARHRPDLMVLDYILFGNTGVDLAWELQDNPATQDIPIVFLTSSSSAENEEMPPTVLGVLKKPLSGPELATELTRLLNSVKA